MLQTCVKNGLIEVRPSGLHVVADVRQVHSRLTGWKPEPQNGRGDGGTAEGAGMESERIEGTGGPAAFVFPAAILKGADADWEASAELLAEWRAAYPLVDVEGELLRMRDWLAGVAPSERKTSAGMRRFVGTWLKGEQRKAAGAGRQDRPALPPAPH